jgi:putative endonuclease
VKRGGYTYVMTNKAHGVLYVGVTAELHTRMHQHRTGGGSAFCRRYGIDRLVLVEPHSTIEAAIAREKQLKNWQRRWKVELIEASNPDWQDLSDHLD